MTNTAEPTGDPKAASLARLRAWREETDKRDPLIYAAHLEKATYEEIHEASRVAVNTIRAAIDRQKEAAMQTATPDRLAAYHHPNFLGMKPGEREGHTITHWKPFTGAEERPQRPQASYEDDSLTQEDRRALTVEYDAAREMWAKARWNRDAGMLVRGQMKPAWEKYAAARGALESAYNALVTGDDAHWGARTNAWLDTHQPALTAASKWDDVTEELAKLYKEYEYEIQEFHVKRLKDAVAEFGVDTDAWEVYYEAEFDNGYRRPTQYDLLSVIDKQKARLKEIRELTGKS